MIKLTLEHVDAINTAKLNLIRLVDRETHPRFKAEVEKRITKLGEVCKFVLQIIYAPNLPYEVQRPQDDQPEIRKPQDNGTAAKQD